MTLVRFGTISKKLIYPIMMSITSMFVVVSTILLNREYTDKNGNKIKYGNHPFTNDLIMFMAEACVIIVFFIQQKNIRFFTADKHAFCDKCYVEIAKWHKGFTTA